MFKLNFKFKESDVITRKECCCCKSKVLKKLSSAIVKSKSLKEKTFLETSICENCGHIQRTKILSEEWMLKMFIYRDSEQLKQGFNPINENIEKNRYNRYKQLGQSLIQKVPPKFLNKIQFIDIGCGPGSGVKSWMDLGFKAAGIEPDISRARYGIKKGVKIYTIPWEDYDFKSSQTSIYTSIQSLEHFYGAENFIKNIVNSMSDESMLYIEVPDSKYSLNDWNDSLYMGHVNNFSQHSLTLLFKRYGLKYIERIRPYQEENMNNNNLCMIASKKKAIKGDKIKLWDKKEVDLYIKRKIKDYCKDLPEPHKKNTCNIYKLHEINDLMMSFKGHDSISPTVKENQMTRSITYEKENIYFVN